MICRQCGTENDSGREDCVRCHQELHPADMKGKIPCAIHGNRPATTSCASCGKRLCDVCAVSVGGIDFCEECAPENGVRVEHDEDYERIPVVDPAKAASASFGRRFLGWLIDAAILIAPALLITLIVFLFTSKLVLFSAQDGGAIFWTYWTVTMVAGIAYAAIMTSMNGQTWGKQVAGVIVLQNDGHVLNLRQSALRSGVAILSAAAFGLGYLWILWDPKHETWHDKIAKTTAFQWEEIA